MEHHDELMRTLAETVVFLRSYICPIHQHVTVLLITHEGPTPWHGPICETSREEQEVLAGQPVQCDFVDERIRILAMAYEALGTQDMSELL